MYCERYRLLKSLWTRLIVSLSGVMILDRLIALSVSGSIHCQRRPIVGAFTATATKYVENDIKKIIRPR